MSSLKKSFVNSSKVLTLFDVWAKINAMIRKIIENAIWTMR